MYIIWGIVFDMCMKAYNNLDLSKTKIENIKEEIEGLESQINADNSSIKQLRQKQLDTKNDVAKLMIKLGHQIYIDYAAIQTEMNNFFAGWIKMMEVLQMSKNELEAASYTCSQVVEQLTKQH